MKRLHLISLAALAIVLATFAALCTPGRSAAAVRLASTRAALVPTRIEPGLAVKLSRNRLVPVIIQLHSLRGLLRLRADISGTHVLKLRQLGPSPFAAASVDARGLDALESSREVARVTEDRVETLADSSAQGTSSNANLADWWDLNRIDLGDALNNGYNGTGQTVAVLDTGVQASHPWLAGKVVGEACYSYPNGCPNGLATQFGAGAAAPCTYNSLCGHGTHVAETAAGVWGVARGASIIAIDIFHRDPATGKPTFSDSDLVNGMYRVYQLSGLFRIAAVNISAGGGGFTGYCDSRSSSFHYWSGVLRNLGIATVVASGNNDYVNGTAWPGCDSNVISVGNTTLDPFGYDAVYGNTSDLTGSNSASFLSVLAPGTHVCAALPVNSSGCWTGTSMATPHVAGAIAQLKQLRPTATVASELTALQSSGQLVTDSRNGVTKRRLDVWQALTYLYNH